jgi:hypothetical protein
MQPKFGRGAAAAAGAALALQVCLGAAVAAPILADDFEGARQFERIEGFARVVTYQRRGIGGGGGFGTFFRTAPRNEYVMLGHIDPDRPIGFGPSRNPSAILYDLDALGIPDDAVALRITFDYAFRQLPRRGPRDLFAVELGDERCLTVRFDERATAECRIEIQPDNDLVFRLVERPTRSNSAVGIDNLIVEALFEPAAPPPGAIAEPVSLALLPISVAGMLITGATRVRSA